MAKKKKTNTTYWIIAIVIIVILAIVLYYPEAPEEIIEEDAPVEEIIEDTTPVYNEDADGYLWGIVCDSEEKTVEFRVTNVGDFKLNLYKGEIPAVQPLMKVSINGRTMKEELCDKHVLEPGETTTCKLTPAVLRIDSATYDQYGLNKLTAISVGARETETFKCE